jgi:uncharacterized small protein (DUF1192 family)
MQHGFYWRVARLQAQTAAKNGVKSAVNGLGE